MMKSLFLICALLLTGCATWRMGSSDSPADRGENFKQFVVGLEAEAIARGLDAELIRQSYGNQTPAPLPEARKAETTQAEFNGFLATYVNRAVNPARVARAQALLAEYATTLAKVNKKTGVEPAMMVALWGMESDFGRHIGSMPLLPTLISMAYKSPRHTMFRAEVFAALQIPGVVNKKGSWAGATGQCQFMPSNVLKYATDGNGDGRADIWGTEADVFASTATFIKALGYTPGQPWRVAVKTPLDMTGIALNTRGLSAPISLAEWRHRGFVGNVALGKYRYYVPEGATGPAFLTAPNYDAILDWNYSSFFATSVFTLAERVGL
jgi:membrane-bound lytic murein transglycosylase B